jgi:hypothetical protein
VGRFFNTASFFSGLRWNQTVSVKLVPGTVTYRGILKELTRRGIVRTSNAPSGDYAEYLVAAMVKRRARR